MPAVSDLGDTSPFPLVPAAALRAGDLLYLGSTAYALVARARADRSWVAVDLCDADHPHPGPHLYYPLHTLLPVAHRGVQAPGTVRTSAEPDDVVVLAVPDLLEMLDRHGRDPELVLEVTEPAVRAIIALVVDLHRIENAHPGWSGTNPLDAVHDWLRRLGIDPAASLEQLADRFVVYGTPTANAHETPW